ncbi:MAG: serine hydrolase [Spirochaetae bacterium HGW-Spirochaetae-3]|jgi:CubicO group peptidase (beta-lactamase class C family)|nr:MAG: serine hydrolase [Spirochaetae bacterium HGW-Spirochaetae-3]
MIVAMETNDDSSRSIELSRRLDLVAASPGAELSGLAFVAIEDGSVSYERYLGRRFIHPTDPSLDLPVTAGTRFRVASISKPFVGVACMMLVEEGLLDLDADVSDYLGWRLRNPAFPDAPITPAMLLSHVSSLRDGGNYSLPPGRSLREFFEPGSDAWEGGAHFAGTPSDPRLAPGGYYAYCNLGFGVIGTILERVTGRRFDLFMRERVLAPLGVGGSFNVRLLSDDGLADLAALYRKGRGEDDWNYAGPWLAQVDDLRGVRPSSNPSDAAIAAYEPGVNATWFSPQGGLRASAREVARLALMFMGRGEVDGARILSAKSVETMREARWTFDRATMNGDLGRGKSRRSGLALFMTTDSRDEFGGNYLREAGGVAMEGHHADAYGLLGGMLFDVDARKGFVYLIGGTSVDPETRGGVFSSYYSWQEGIQAAAVDYLYGSR